ncbi:hypothetical protein A1D23_09205 [Chelonobacter oris]|uniref:DUF5358 family protein n=1 Tax=Chelonobacter oris TaxID=505317 RepID=UPI0024482BA4|nr:DUF5358 family protein [Chelonobacter oris]MDH3000355.1 hypothetical protein [Chelonobacter oris]
MMPKKIFYRRGMFNRFIKHRIVAKIRIPFKSSGYGMFKKVMVPAVIFLIAGCASEMPSTAFPAEFANADYVLSDSDAKKWVIASRQAEQCGVLIIFA